MADLQDRLGASPALADRYRLERELGRGGMATVFLASDLRHRRRVAFKVLHPELAFALGADRFLREIDTIAGLTHPHIVPLFDSGEVPPSGPAGGDRLLWYTMPYIEGESLRDRLGREIQLPVADAVRIATEVADALDYAHGHGVVHRDIKPENILLAGGHAMMTDFGIARAVAHAGGDRLTQTGISVGTPMYMSPEQLAGGRDVDARSDIYSLGCVLFEMLAGQPPYTGPTQEAAIARRLTEPAPSVGALREAVPAPVQQAVENALARVPADRFPTAGAFARALAEPATMKTSPVTRPRRRLWLGGVGALAAVALVYVYVHRHGTRADRGTGAPRSLAVMPFTSPEQDSTNAYLGAGIAEELTTAFARVPGLRVASRGSASRFQETGASEAEVAKQLDVETILEGTVRRSGDRLRVTARLVDPRDRTVLWADQYDRRMAEVFDVQDDMARAIAAALRPTLTDTATESATRALRGTADLEAYDLYLKGRYYWSRRGRAGLLASVDFYQRALSRDSGFARAWAGLSMTQATLPWFSDLPIDSLLLASSRNARRALALDSTLADAHLAWAYALKSEWRWAESEQQFRQAIALAPEDATAHHWYGVLLYVTGRADEAVRELQVARRLDPLAVQVGTDLYYGLYLARRYDDALAEARRVWPMDTTKADGSLQIGMIQLALGRPDSALVAFEDAQRLGIGFDMRAFLSVAARRLGRGREADSLYRTTLDRYRNDPSLAYAVAIAAAGALDLERGIGAVTTAVKNRSPYFSEVSLPCDPLLDPLKRDARFGSVLAKTGMRVCPA